MKHKKLQFENFLLTEVKSEDIDKVLEAKSEVEDYIHSNQEEFKEIIHKFELSSKDGGLSYKVVSYKKPMLN